MMPSQEITKTLVQCDFDGTVIKDDISMKILEDFADGNWQQMFKEYHDGKMSVGQFSAEAFALVKADKRSLLEVAQNNAKIRPGFNELVACCRRKNFRLVIVSNGLDFYIKEILHNTGIRDIEVFAAQTRFHPDGLKVQYIGPDGNRLDNEFKIAYVNLFLEQGYRVIYIGDGISDVSPARRCHYIFATDNLMTLCKQANLTCTPFTDFNELVRVLESL